MYEIKNDSLDYFQMSVELIIFEASFSRGKWVVISIAET